MAIAFVALLVVYFFVSRRLDQWDTMKLLGEPGECPGPFLSHPMRYRLVSYALFLGIIAFGIFSRDINGWLAVFFAGLVSVVSAKSGKAAGFRRYRAVGERDKALFSGPDFANDPMTPQRIEYCERRMAMTNAELQEKINFAIRGDPRSRRNSR